MFAGNSVLFLLCTLLYIDAVDSLQVPGPTKLMSHIVNILGNNPLAQIIDRSYSFFYWLPRRNLPYDSPFVYFKNSSVDFISWYQVPHNLPPYRYLVSCLADSSEFKMISLFSRKYESIVMMFSTTFRAMDTLKISSVTDCQETHFH